MATLTGATTENDLEKIDYVDGEKIERLRGLMQDDETVYALADTFSALGDPTRARIIFALSREELCVQDLAHLLEVSASAVSHQLRLLRVQRLVRFRKAGRLVYYSLVDDHIRTIFAQALDHVRELYHLKDEG
jgi:ArsR family transcriptional regulator